ncbi:reprolysin-like metallopeptidase [Nocardioides currus]|uniref:Uncharacterized protein n=1 Tax=Nocardioides currus TaxID=2133958 RepID=A0A2R7Z0Z3_9ACTN|nr:M12 family metallo-peptidase [Nocardioides currus]PUA82293.1 hypothetical protein C7S10_00585 [Nocardioides currus]
MTSRTTRGAVRRTTALALLATLVASGTSLAPAVAKTDEAAPPRLETDAVVPNPSAQELARRTIVDHAPADARMTDAKRKADAGNVVDVAFVYPAALVSQADIGGLSGLRAKFSAQIADANTSFKNSGIPVELRYVGDRQVAAPTTTNLQTMLTQLGKPGDGVYDEAQALREETHADLVSLWVSGSVPLGSSCGIGNLSGIQPQYDPEYAAFTTLFYTDCIDDFRVFAHEIGHNFSGNHDVGSSQPPSNGKPYARGFTDPAHKFITVMAYYDACAAVNVSCTRIPYFSGPNVKTPEGYPTGNAAADNVRAITEQAPTVANYRQSQIYGAVPTISGQPNRGGTLTANTPGWAPGNVTFTYQWFANGAPIAGATGATLKLGDAQVGTVITVAVTGNAPYYQPVAVGSAATPAIGKSLFTRTTKPKIKGAARPGSKLKASVKAWKPGKVKYKFTWLRNGKAIKGAKGKTYRVKGKDRGKKIQVKVTGKRSGFETVSRTSKKIKIRR